MQNDPYAPRLPREVWNADTIRLLARLHDWNNIRLLDMPMEPVFYLTEDGWHLGWEAKFDFGPAVLSADCKPANWLSKAPRTPENEHLLVTSMLENQ